MPLYWWENWWEIFPSLKPFNTLLQLTISSLPNKNEMANTIKVLFWLHRSKANNEGLAPLIIRLSFQKTKIDKATGYYLNPNDWNITKQQVKGNKEVSNDINGWINSRISKISLFCRENETSDNFHLPTIMANLFLKVKDEPTLLIVMEKHNLELKARLKNDYSYSTYEKYVFTYNKVKAFIEQHLKRKDILLKEITTKFIMDFDNYLRVNDSNQHNTAVKYCLNLKRVLNVAVMQGLLPSNPLNVYKTIYKDTPQVYLTQHEVETLENITLLKASHLLVRDLFIFQCNTGLAYTDMVRLRFKDISIDHNERKWIVKPRQKTSIISTIPLLPKALQIIEKYNGSQENALFPSYSIQKYNQYIAEIGVNAGIPKRLSSHVGRRTFGNIALAKGLSINVISKILGHSNTIITQRIYAITTQNIISQEMKKW